MGLIDAPSRAPSNAKALARILYKLLYGQAVKITWLGDSVIEGTTVTSGGGVLGTDDCASLVNSTLAARYATATLTKQNRAVSGRTVAHGVIDKWALALADNADLYVFAFGKNDIAYGSLTSPTRLQGQENDSSVGLLEAKVAELRHLKPNACIAIMTTNPYSAASTTLNALQTQWDTAAERVARAYDCEFIDGYAAFTALGSWDTYLSDGVHPNKNGHILLANAVLAHFPLGWTERYADDQNAKFVAPAGPGINRLYAPGANSRVGIGTLSVAVVTNYAAKLGKAGTAGGTGADSWTGSGPYTTTAAGNTMFCVFPGFEAYLLITMGAGQGIVDIYIDGVKTYASVDLTTMANGKLLHITGLGPGWHSVAVTNVSGSLTFTNYSYLANRSQFVNYDAPQVVAASMGSGSALTLTPGGTGIATANGGSLTIPFIGTGIGFSWFRSGGGGGSFFANSTIDGVALTVPALVTGATGYGFAPAVTGLPYGKHTLVLGFQAAGISIGGFYIVDEQPTARPGEVQGWAGAAEVVKFTTPFASIPVVTMKDPLGGMTFTSVSTTGFTNGATAGWWVAKAADDAALNRLSY